MERGEGLPDLPSGKACKETYQDAIFKTPRWPVANQRMIITAVSETDHPGARIVVRSPQGEVMALDTRGKGGPPWWWTADLPSPSKGTWTIALISGTEVHSCYEPTVRQYQVKLKPTAVIWEVTRSWHRDVENFYSAWIERLFEAPPEEQVSWKPLHEALRDPERNVLYNYLGLGEDDPKYKYNVPVKPDCADAPYFLRAYFAWKMRLPFAYSMCNRGSSTAPPRCGEAETNFQPPEDPSERRVTSIFADFLQRKVGWTVHSGSARTSPDYDKGDLYPLAMSRHSLRPGVVFVDPYGHLLVVSQWVSQGEESSGILYAIDGHPDLSVGRKRFWRGAFLFNDDLRGGAGGFKAFRPVMRRKGPDGEMELFPLGNHAIKSHPGYGNISTEQYSLSLEGFYDRMDSIINPRPRQPSRAYLDMLQALYELMMERVGSVAAGEEYMERKQYKTISMPRGPEIFETSGAWEDYSTPSRDLRLLIAMDLVSSFPEKVIRQPERYVGVAGRDPEGIRAELGALAKGFLLSHGVTYRRSDGQPFSLTLDEVMRRGRAFEVAYNPNDCVEIRWGAPEGSGEMSSCKRRASKGQMGLMEQYRPWFAQRRRPPR